jgi:hypothetical protein
MKKRILDPKAASDNHLEHGTTTAGKPANHQTQDYCHESGEVSRDDIDGDGSEHLLEQLQEPPLYYSKKGWGRKEQDQSRHDLSMDAAPRC